MKRPAFLLRSRPGVGKSTVLAALLACALTLSSGAADWPMEQNEDA